MIKKRGNTKTVTTTDKEYALIKAAADKAEKSIAAYMREAAIEKACKELQRMKTTNFTYSGELVKTRFKRIECDIPARFKNIRREHSRFPPKELYSFDGKHYSLKPV